MFRTTQPDINLENYIVPQSLVQNNFEIPNWVATALPNYRAMVETLELRSNPDSGTLYTEFQLMYDKSSMVMHNLKNRSLMIYDLLNTTGTSIFPLVFEAFNNSQVAGYVPVTINEGKNQYAIQRLRTFCQQAKIGNIKRSHCFSLVKNLTKENIREDVIRIKDSLANNGNITDSMSSQKRQDTINMFVITTSFFGNVLNPQETINNIADSMQSGDYLVMLQAVDAGNINQIVEDNTMLFPNLYNTNILCKKLNPDYQPVVYYDEEIQGIQVKITIERPVQIKDLTLETGQEIKMFRYMMLPRQTIEQMLKNAGLVFDEIGSSEDGLSVLFKYYKP